MTDAVANDAANPVRFARSITVDARFADRVTLAALRSIFLTPGRLVRTGLLIVVVGTFIPLAQSNGHPSSWLFLRAALAMVAVLALIYVLAYFFSRRQLRARLPVGTVYSIVMRDDTLTLTDPLASTEVSYKLYKSVSSAHGLVTLVPVVARRATLLPAELFTPESLDWVKARIGR